MTKRQTDEKRKRQKDKIKKKAKRQKIKNTKTRRKDKKTTYCDDRAVSYTGNVCFSLAHFKA